MLESNEVIPKEDAEIRRLVEERRTTPEEEKQRWKEVSKQKIASGTRKERKDRKKFNRYSKTSKGLRTSQESNLQRRECSSPR